MTNKIFTSLAIAFTSFICEAGEWRLSGEARFGESEWIPIESQSDSVDTRVGTEPQLLLPGSLGPPPIPAMGTVGGVALGDGWTYYIAIENLRLVTGTAKFEFALRDHTAGEEQVWGTFTQPFDMKADFSNSCYYVEQERTSPVPSTNSSVEVRFRIDRCVPLPELLLDEDPYDYSLWESFDLDFLPVPVVGKIYLQTRAGAEDWTTFSVKPTWFERGDPSVVFGPTSRKWSNIPNRDQTTFRSFRAYQVPFDPSVHTNVTHDVEVAGVVTQLDYLRFGSDCDEVIVHAQWSLPPGVGQLELGFFNSKGSFGTVRSGGGYLYETVERWPDGTNWVIYAKPPE